MNNVKPMKLVFEAFEEAKLHIWLGDEKGVAAYVECAEAITALRQAIEQAQQAEPVAWVSTDELLVMKGNALAGAKDWRINVGLVKQDGDVGLYISPPPRQPLTENEIKHLWYEACQTSLELTSQLIVHLARNIEKAHGIKGEA